MLFKIRQQLKQAFSPPSILHNDAERRRARLLSIMLIPFGISTITGAFFTPFPVSPSLAVISVILGIAYLLSRTRYASMGAALAVLAGITPSFIVPFTLAEFSVSELWKPMPWLALPILLAAIWLPLRPAIAIFTAILIFMATLPTVIPGLEFSHIRSPLIFTALAISLAIIGIYLTRQDQQKLEAQTAEAQYLHLLHETVLDNIDEAVIVFSPEGCVTSFNQQTLEVFRMDNDAREHSDIYRFLPPVTDDLQQFLRGETSSSDFRPQIAWESIELHRFNGQAFTADVTIRQLTIRNLPCYLAIVNDLSIILEAEAIKNDFVGTVSHELRTPLTSIHGSLGLIRGNYQHKLDKNLDRLTDIAYRNSQMLLELVNDILDLASLERQKIEFRPVETDIVELIQQAIIDNSPFAQTNSISIELKTDETTCTAIVDPIRLRQVINNLLSNAIKFSYENSDVSILLHQTDASIRVDVIDHGAGISQAFKNSVFQKFSRAETDDGRKHYGTGLGLSICKEIVSQMGGKIAFESEPEVKTQFYFELPRWMNEEKTRRSTQTIPTAPPSEL